MSTICGVENPKSVPRKQGAKKPTEAKKTTEAKKK